MQLDRLNRWLTPIANIGVLIGIFLVALELNLSRQDIRAQTRNHIAVQIVDLMSQGATDPELATILMAVEAGSELSPVQANQFLHRFLAMSRYWENVHYQYRQGLFDESEYATQIEAIRASGYTRSQASRDIWCASREYYSPSFRAAFDSLLAAPC